MGPQFKPLPQYSDGALIMYNHLKALAGPLASPRILTIESDNMAPTLAYGDRILVDAGTIEIDAAGGVYACLLYTSPSPRDKRQSRMPSSA